MSSGTESNSHFCCAPGMGQLQRIIGHSYCRGFSSFLLPTRGPGLGECGSGHQTQHSEEGPHSLDVYSNVSAQGGGVASGLLPFIPAAGCVLHAPCVPGRDLSELFCMPLDGSTGTGTERGTWCSSSISLD